MAGEQILIVDDEKEIRDLIQIYLKNEGYQVFMAADGKEALSFLAEHDVALVILDWMLPAVSGMEVCLEIRRRADTPILMLSAKNQDMDKVMGLTAGADDYVTKPFHPLELMARVRSLLRRAAKIESSGKNAAVIVIDDLQIHSANHEVWVNGQEVKLTPREFSILELLARHRGQVFSAERIYEAVWKEELYGGDNTVMVHIRRLREKLEPDSHQPTYIKTVWGVGYKIEK